MFNGYEIREFTKGLFAIDKIKNGEVIEVNAYFTSYNDAVEAVWLWIEGSEAK